MLWLLPSCHRRRATLRKFPTAYLQGFQLPLHHFWDRNGERESPQGSWMHLPRSAFLKFEAPLTGPCCSMNFFLLWHHVVGFVSWGLSPLTSGRFRSSIHCMRYKPVKLFCCSPRANILDIASTSAPISFSWIWPHSLERECALLPGCAEVLRTAQMSQ